MRFDFPCLVGNAHPNAMTQRYYLESASPLAAGSPARLTEGEAHHFLHVMRGQVGDRLTLFDGRGNQAEATVTAVTRREVEVRPGAVSHDPGVLSLPLEMAVSLPKGDRARWLVEKLTELGVASLTPLSTQRSIAQPGGKALDKLRRYSIEACKQSGRNQLLRLNEACSIGDFDRAVSRAGRENEIAKMAAHPHGNTLPAGRSLSSAVQAERSLALAIGPEGGFSEAELDLLGSLGWQSISLGPRILRIETAALALASFLALMHSPA